MRWVGLLRGVNVGGRHRLAMTDLRQACVDAGATEVVTYIQSGNVVFTHPSRVAGPLTADLEARLSGVAGFAVPVMLRTGAQMRAVMEKVPFGDVGDVHVAFLSAKPDASAVKAVDAGRFAPDELAVVGTEAYLYLPNGLGRSKLPPALSRLKVPATLRNWRTVAKLADMAGA